MSVLYSWEQGELKERTIGFPSLFITTSLKLKIQSGNVKTI